MFNIVCNGTPLYYRVDDTVIRRSFTQYQGFEIEHFETREDAEKLITNGRVFYRGAEIVTA